MKELQKFRRVNGITQGDLAAYLGTGRGFISRVENGRAVLLEGHLRLIRDNLRGWDTSALSSPDEAALSALTGIRLWRGTDAAGGGPARYDGALGTRYTRMNLPGFRDCTDALRFVGNSMSPRYKSGWILIFKKWEEPFVEYGRAYLVITQSGYRMVKYLYPSEDSGDAYKCVSENNEDYPPFDIGKNEIYALYLVKGAISQETY